MRRKECYFDRNKIDFIDYTDIQGLRHYITNWARIKGAQDTGICSNHQRQLTHAIKRARYLALLPYTTR